MRNWIQGLREINLNKGREVLVELVVLMVFSYYLSNLLLIFSYPPPRYLSKVICNWFSVILLHVKNVLVHLVPTHTDIEIQRQKSLFAVFSATRQFTKRCRVEIQATSVCSSLFCETMQVFLLHNRLCDDCSVITMTTDVGEGLLKFFI